MRIVQLANFYGPRSGGLRTALHHLGEGYAAAGHEVVLIVPGPRRSEEILPTGVVRITLPALAIPWTGGYRAADPRRVADVLTGLRPDVLEVSDRLTLRGFGRWARRRDVTGVMISHERLDRLLGQVLPGPVARRCADVANRHTAGEYDMVVCTTRFAREEFLRIGASNVELVPLGVDLELFSPRRRDRGLRADLGVPGHPLLVHCGRLSVEKRVDRSIEAVGALREAGIEARLVVAGDGPRRDALQRRARALPELPGGVPAVHFTGFISDRAMVAKLLATADVSLAPGPHETFGLAALEALAAGTPVVA
ncbi:glycosyltransferase, partial [Nocardia amamiensis]|uniref:glycosyltransferase n=1 Tax=Nocardia amamiensis TaxID=404578 RepID=UPI000835F11E